MFDPVHPKQSFPDLERGILQYWRDEAIFHRSIAERSSKQTFSFYDGPPFATGLPHYGHLLAGTIKDVIPRYRTMRGMRVERRFGWDCHGLPIENLIEKEHQLSGTQDIEEMGIDRFNDLCRGSVQRYVTEWRETVERMGRWVDMDNDYKTMDPTYMESLWWVFSTLCSKNLIYEGHKPMHICPRCVTPLSNFEVTQGYQDISDQSATVRFRLLSSDDLSPYPVSLLAWTTTPWTLPGNMLLAMNPSMEYVIVDHNNESFILASSRVEEVCKDMEISSKNIRKISAKSLENRSYEPLFPYFAQTPDAFRIVLADFVTDTDGTGIVHIAPGFGEEDFTIGKREGLSLIQHVRMDGRFTEEVTDFAREEVKPADDPSKTDRSIIAFLDANGRLLSQQKVRHSYPHCWRCDSPLLNYATASWFVAVEEIKERLLDANAKTQWVPAHIRDGRFGKWLENARDWAISRNRYWGTPLPVWRVPGRTGGSIDVVGSRTDLMERCRIRFTKISTVRHGEAEHNVGGFYQSKQPGVNLTEQGRKQAETAAESLVNQKVDIIYCSPLARTRQTAEILASATGAEIIVDERLREVDVGEHEGESFHLDDLSLAVLKRQKRLRSNAPESIYHLEGMESWASIQERIDAFFHDILPRHRSQHVVVVSHGDPLQCIEHFFTREDPYKISNRPLPRFATPKQYFWDHDYEAEMDLHRDRIDHIAWPGEEDASDPVVTFVRHGETEWNAKGLIQGGGQDIPLNDTGREQAAAVLKKIQGQAFDCIVSSPMQRCTETAAIIAESMGIAPVETLDLLKERDAGVWGGKPVSDIPEPHISNPVFHPCTPEGGESLGAFLRRMQEAYEVIRQRFPGKRVLVVAHRGVLQAMQTLVENRSYAQAVATLPQNGDAITLRLPALMRRTPEVLDCWFESGSMPYAQQQFPFAAGMKDGSHPPHFPADFVAENLDQTRGWFYTLMVLSTALFDTPAFHHCICGGIVLAEDGRKMSKRLKNYPDPSEVMERYGADALRFALMSSPVVRAETLRFSERGVEEAVQRILLPLWNSYSFFVTYARLSSFEPSSSPTVSPHPLDRWILAEVQDLTNRMTEQLESYDLSATCMELHDTVDALTNWYIRLSRKRFLGQADSITKQDQNHALHTLYDVLLTLSRLLAPICPFVTEAIYLNLTEEPHSSVHLTSWPSAAALSEEEQTLLLRTRLLRQCVSLGLTVRSDAKIKQRQPLQKATLAFPADLLPGGPLTEEEKALLAQELNVHELAVQENPGDLAMPIVYVDARATGPRLGKRVQEIIAAGKRGEFTRNEDGSILIADVTLAPDEFTIRFVGREGTNVAGEGGIVVSIDTVLTDALRMEGLARDTIRTVQKLRKEQGFSVGQHIALGLSGIDDVLALHVDMIEQETCSKIRAADTDAVEVELDAEHTLRISLPSHPPKAE